MKTRREEAAREVVEAFRAVGQQVNILFAVSECVPFVKSGGLADVAGALPKELKKLGVEVRIILPNYSLIPQKLRDGCTLHKVINVPLGWRNQYCGILKGEQDGITYYLIDNDHTENPS